ncbi:hypothetical protein OEV98_15090 [Caldibacillus lycopersici]|uniref:Uncharacterized protein n=1 Tax=Perspicuibacillus lycopersici TaxID=1325689 RepID=A0AAE3IWG9_9BACI|nr:hypothetical protein [Perspicuibacillus lycopersici]MCU9614868.1 hypothetical protein [Perspicuibacillus lycopersici]
MFVVLIRILLLSTWATLFFVPKKSIKRFLPVTTMSAFLTMTTVFIGSYFNFWEIKGGNKARIYNLLSLLVGAFSVGTLWIFKWTYGKFWLYLLINVAQNILYAFPIISFFEKMNFIKYVKFTRIHHLIVSLSYSLILYVYQWFLEKPYTKGLKFLNLQALR